MPWVSESDVETEFPQGITFVAADMYDAREGVSAPDVVATE